MHSSEESKNKKEKEYVLVITKYITSRCVMAVNHSRKKPCNIFSMNKHLSDSTGKKDQVSPFCRPSSYRTDIQK